MATDAAHSRKSRLAVPVGSDTPVSPSAPIARTNSSSAGHKKKATPASAASASLLSGGTTTATGHHHSHHPHNRPKQYLQRMTDIRQMDIQSALDQMRTLLSTRPKLVYKTAYYRKQTKGHWARDDPAFCALQLVFLFIASIAYSVAFRIKLVPGAISFLLSSVLWNWLGLGILISSTCRELANRHLTNHQTSNSHVRQNVEWLYAFDIHCNSFFPVFVLLYGVQFFALPVALGEGLLPLFVSNTLYGAAFAWYWYITHLGYRSLPFLSNTEVFLFPIAGVAVLYLTMLIGYPFGFGWNAARVMARFYFI